MGRELTRFLIRRRAILAGLGLAAVGAGIFVLKTSGGWQRAGEVEGRLVSAITGTGAKSTVQLGIHLRLDPGWKTYWRSPGEAGLPPRFDWSASENLAGVDVSYPAPHRFDTAGIATLGYKEEVVLPILARLKDVTKPLAIDLDASLLLCKDICIPQRLHLKLVIPASSRSASPEAALIDGFAAKVPRRDATQAMRIDSTTAIPLSEGGGLLVRISANEALKAPDVFVESLPGDLVLGVPEVHLLPDAHAAVLRLPVTQGSDAMAQLPGHDLVLTVVDGARAIESRQRVGLGSKSAPLHDGEASGR